MRVETTERLRVWKAKAAGQRGRSSNSPTISRRGQTSQQSSATRGKAGSGRLGGGAALSQHPITLLPFETRLQGVSP